LQEIDIRLIKEKKLKVAKQEVDSSALFAEIAELKLCWHKK
jgi:hypothetical protein